MKSQFVKKIIKQVYSLFCHYITFFVLIYYIWIYYA